MLAEGLEAQHIAVTLVIAVAVYAVPAAIRWMQARRESGDRSAAAKQTREQQAQQFLNDQQRVLLETLSASHKVAREELAALETRTVGMLQTIAGLDETGRAREQAVQVLQRQHAECLEHHEQCNEQVASLQRRVAELEKGHV